MRGGRLNRDWWPCYPDHVPEVNHSIHHPQRHKPRVPRQPSLQVCNLEHFPLLFPLTTIFNLCNAGHMKIRPRSLGVDTSVKKGCLFHHEQNIADFIIKYWLHILFSEPILLKPWTSCFLSREGFCCYFCCFFFFSKDVLPESSWQHIIRSY